MPELDAEFARKPLALVVRSRRYRMFVGLCVLVLVGITPWQILRAQGLTGSIKGTVSAASADPSARAYLVPGARLTLVNRDVQGAPVKTVTDETGNFAFLDLPSANYVLAAEADGLPGAKQEIHLTTGATLVVEIVLTATVTESVTVHQEEGLLSTSETTTSNTVRAEKLEELPLRSENYQSALPLTPGVVRGADGLNHVKGTRSGQSSYTVNGADVTDPLTGNLAFDIPVEAAESVHIEENPYSAEFGRAAGGATNLETKTGGNKFKFTLSRFFPTYRNIISGKLDSFRPRMTFSGPLIRNRLSFLQSFEYRYSRVRVPSLKAPRDDSASESFDSFTQFDLTINKRHSLKFVGGLFPQKVRFVGLDTFNPQETRPNTKQRGELFSLSEQAIFSNESFLSSLVSYKTFHFQVFPQGPMGLTYLPDGNTGNYFVNSQRSSKRLQWLENYFAHPISAGGQHSLKLGTLSQRIDFAGPTSLNRSLREIGGFIQDRWLIRKSLTLDLGTRFDRDSISKRVNFAPRLGLMFLPFGNDRTIVRGGVGLFYDRSPLSSRYFIPWQLDENDDPLFDSSVLGVAAPGRFPERIVTSYAPDGVTVIDGHRHFANVIRGPLHDARSTRWSVQVDRGITKHLTARIGFLQRSTMNEAIVIPRVNRFGEGMYVLKSSGRSQYREAQALLAYDNQRFHNWNFSYVWSKARGDLNTSDNFLSDFPSLVIRANQYGPLPFDAPHRFLAYGELKAPMAITITPAFEIRSGFPFSIVDDGLDFVGLRNRAGRFPMFMSLDVQILKGFKIPFFDKRARGGVAIFNITNHFNPRDVQNNTGSQHLGQFFNSLGTSIRAKFEMDF